MNWIDLTILTILGLSTLLSVKRGFVKEALSLLAWVAAFFVSTAFSARLSAQLVELISSEPLRYACAYVILFAATLMLGSLVNLLLSQVIKVTGLSGADRVLGTVFGFTRGLVVILVVLFVLRAAMPAADQQFVQESMLLPHLEMIEQWARQNFADVAASGRVPWI